MTFNVLVRGFTPRPWKSQKSGKSGYSGKYVLLDTSPVCIMDTVGLETEFQNEADMLAGASLVGKNCVLDCTGLRVGMDGEAEFVGTRRLAPK